MKEKEADKDNYIFGIRPIIEALNADKEIDKLLIQQDIRGPLITELRKAIKKNKTPYSHVPIQKLNFITKKNHQGVIGFISPVTTFNIEDIIPGLYEKGKVPFILILDRISDVRNFGAITRTAECVGVDAVIISKKGSAQINADAVKTSTGALHRIPICKESNLKETVQFLKESGVQIIGCTEKTDDLIYKNNYTVPTAIIMGSEENGISSQLLNLCDGKAKIPMIGEIASLNVSVAAGVILYEAIKQRLDNQ